MAIGSVEIGQYARRPLKLTNQGSAKSYVKATTPMLVTDVTVTTLKYWFQVRLQKSNRRHSVQ